MHRFILPYIPIVALAVVLFPWTLLAASSELSQANDFVAQDRFADAIVIYDRYLKTHPDDDETRGKLGRLLSWNKEYGRAIATFRDLLDRHPADVDVRIALGRVQAWDHQYPAAERTLRYAYALDPSNHEAQEALADLYFWTDRHTEALHLYTTLPVDPSRTDLARRIDAVRSLTTTSPRAPSESGNDRQLPYRRYIKTGYTHSLYTKAIPDERDWLTETAFPWGSQTVVARFERIHRFGFHDSQISGEWYGTGWAGGWGYLSGTAAPNSTVVPRWSLGGEWFQNLAPLSSHLSFLEPSFGYRHLSYPTTEVHLVQPGITVYFPADFWVTEKLYYVPTTGAMTLSSQLTWRPLPRLQFYASYGFGTAGERLVATQDLTRVHSHIYQAGVYFPLSKQWAADIRGTYEDRDGLYTRREGAVTLSYLW